MTGQLVQFSCALRRIEVRSVTDSDADDFRWVIIIAAGPDGKVNLGGYLRQRVSEGFGQVQSMGHAHEFDWASVSESSDAKAEFEEWARKYAAQNLYDTGRRALQMQAALMDFQFNLPIEAPEADIVYSGGAKPKTNRVSRNQASSTKG